MVGLPRQDPDTRPAGVVATGNGEEGTNLLKETPLRHWSFVSPVDVTPHRGVRGLRTAIALRGRATDDTEQDQ